MRELVNARAVGVPLSQRPHCGDAIVSLLARDSAGGSASGPDPRIASTSMHCRRRRCAVRVTRANADLLRTFPEWRDEVDERQPFIVSVEDGAAVALCCSVRITRGGARGRRRNVARCATQRHGVASGSGVGEGGRRTGRDRVVQHVVGQRRVASGGAAARHEADRRRFSRDLKENDGPPRTQSTRMESRFHRRRALVGAGERGRDRTRAARRLAGDSHAGQAGAGGLVRRAASARRCCVSRRPGVNRHRSSRRPAPTSSASTCPRNSSRATWRWPCATVSRLRYVRGDMADLSAFRDAAFDLIFHAGIERVRAGSAAGVARMPSGAATWRRAARGLHESGVLSLRSRRSGAHAECWWRSIACRTASWASASSPLSDARREQIANGDALRVRPQPAGADRRPAGRRISSHRVVRRPLARVRRRRSMR